MPLGGTKGQETLKPPVVNRLMVKNVFRHVFICYTSVNFLREFQCFHLKISKFL